MKEVTGTLNNWVWDAKHNVYWGNITGDIHKRFRDGTWIHTSIVNKEDHNKEEGGCIIHTLNSIYFLAEKGQK